MYCLLKRVCVYILAGNFPGWDSEGVKSQPSVYIHLTDKVVPTVAEVHENPPQYLQELVSPENPSHSLRYSSQRRRSISRFRKNSTKKHSGPGAWSFCNAVPHLWNRLPNTPQNTKGIASFQQQLKLCLFSTP